VPSDELFILAGRAMQVASLLLQTGLRCIAIAAPQSPPTDHNRYRRNRSAQLACVMRPPRNFTPMACN
jgi:hypothetical protein